jgi:hypothetical protein
MTATDPQNERAEFITTHLRPDVDVRLQGDGDKLELADVLDVHNKLIDLAHKASGTGLSIATSQFVPTLDDVGAEQWVHLDHATKDQLNLALMVAAGEVAALQREALAAMDRAIVLGWLIERPETVAKEN